MLTTSDDNTAELLVKELGYHVNGQGSTASGVTVIENALTGWGIDATKIHTVDGSGLDSTDTVTCNILLQVLLHRPLTDPVGAGLAIAGETGTLASEFKASPVDGRLHAKTGTLKSVKALTGYIDTSAGPVEFAMLLNETSIGVSPNYEPMWNALATALATYPSGPTIEQLEPK